MRWTNDESARFQALRRAEARGELLDAERAELEAMLAELDADEAKVLRPAQERMTAEAAAMAKETAGLEAKARELLRIAEEEERLLSDARVYLERLRQRSAALAEDYLRVTGHELAPAR
jgi:cell division septum initiation protein DivIVA